MFVSHHDPNQSGRLSVTFIIEPQGNVSVVKAQKHPFSRAIGECVVGVMRDAKFPRPDGGGTVIVKEYPFVFEVGPAL